MYSTYRSLFICFLIFCASILHAQHDTTFIELFDNSFRINTGFKYLDRSVAFSTSAGESFSLESQRLAYRIGGRYKWISYTLSIPVTDLGNATDQQNGTSFGLGSTLFLHKYLLNASFRNTVGFSTKMTGKEAVFRDDISLFQASVFGFRVLNSEHFSIRASFRQRERQLKNSGSLLVGGLIDRTLMQMNNGLSVPLRNGDQAFLTRYAQTKIGLGAGYAYTLVLGDHWFITPMVFVGPDFRFVTFDEQASFRKRDKLMVSPQIRGYFALGWNGDPLAVSLTGILLPGFDNTDSLDTTSKDLVVELRITRRF